MGIILCRVLFTWVIFVNDAKIIFPELCTVTALDRNGVKVVLAASRGTDDAVTLTMRAGNITTNTLTDFLFQAAVPRVCAISLVTQFFFKYKVFL